MSAADEVEQLRNALKELKNMVHDMIVANQAAWIEWQHGGGADEAMQWIENGLCGPGLLPCEPAPYWDEAQAWFDSNRSNPFPACFCGRPSNQLWRDKGFCSHAHYSEARTADEFKAAGEQS